MSDKNFLQEGREVINGLVTELKKRKEISKYTSPIENEIVFTDKQLKIISKLSNPPGFWIRGTKTPECIKRRAIILIKYIEGLNKTQIAKEMDIDPRTVLNQ